MLRTAKSAIIASLMLASVADSAWDWDGLQTVCAGARLLGQWWNTTDSTENDSKIWSSIKKFDDGPLREDPSSESDSCQEHPCGSKVGSSSDSESRQTASSHSDSDATNDKASCPANDSVLARARKIGLASLARAMKSKPKRSREEEENDLRDMCKESRARVRPVVVPFNKGIRTITVLRGGFTELGDNIESIEIRGRTGDSLLAYVNYADKKPVHVEVFSVYDNFLQTQEIKTIKKGARSSNLNTFELRTNDHIPEYRVLPDWRAEASSTEFVTPPGESFSATLFQGKEQNSKGWIHVDGKGYLPYTNEINGKVVRYFGLKRQ